MTAARRHHNNYGHRQIRRGATAKQVERMCRRLKLPFRHEKLCVEQAAEAARDDEAHQS